MNAEKVLRENENSALNNNQIISSVMGKTHVSGKAKNIKGITAAGFITVMIVVFAFLFSSGNLIPTAISERLIEETDVQYADAVESKKLVFQQALKNGELPDNTVEILNKYGVEVGYLENGVFKERNKSDSELVLKFNDNFITADNFIESVSNDTKLYNAFNNATYSRAAYYYDDSAEKVFNKIGTSRNNYTSDSDFDEVMSEKMGSGSNINIGSVSQEKNNKGETVTKENGTASSKLSDFINSVKNSNSSLTVNESTLNTADSLKVADTISKEQRSSLFYTLFMENISKMKAGEGNESKINEEMNFLYEESESEIVDVETGEIIKTTGSALDSPSLYAILSGEKVDTEKVENYSSDRILKTVENKLGESGSSTIKNTVTSTSGKAIGSISKIINFGIERASDAIIDLVSPTVSSSLVDNSYDTIKGVNAGEFLAEGAVNTGRMLAQASGATAGDTESVTKYAKLNSEIVAMDAKVDRENRSPFDMTSKNTFLGSIIYNFAISNNLKNNSTAVNFSSLINSTGNAISSLMPGAYADEISSYLTSFGDCETYSTISAAGTAHCSEIATFDTSTLNDTFNDPDFVAFVESNTTLNSSGNRSINNASVLAKFILYNNERNTPLGVVDGGILDSLSNNSSSISFISNILELGEKFFGASDNDKKIATGEAFVNSSSNSDWQNYKYAQRYVSLARATEALRQYSGDSTAYNNITYFEGDTNPVIAFLDNYYNLAQK
jgi:hypothetical protein